MDGEDQNKRKEQYRHSAIHVGIGILGILGVIMYQLITR